MRIVRDVAIYALLVTLGACARPLPPVQTFDDACPPAWTFLYTDYTAAQPVGTRKVVCRPPGAARDSLPPARAGSSF